MSGLSFSLSNELSTFKKFLKAFPQMEVRTLSSVAKQGRLLLRKDLLSGQALNLKSGITDSSGRHMVSGRVGGRMTIVFKSYPVNLFERGRHWESGKSERGRFIITKQFKSLLSANLQRFAHAAYRKTVEWEARKV